MYLPQLPKLQSTSLVHVQLYYLHSCTYHFNSCTRGLVININKHLPNKAVTAIEFRVVKNWNDTQIKGTHMLNAWLEGLFCPNELSPIPTTVTELSPWFLSSNVLLLLLLQSRHVYFAKIQDQWVSQHFGSNQIYKFVLRKVRKAQKSRVDCSTCTQELGEQTTFYSVTYHHFWSLTKNSTFEITLIRQIHYKKHVPKA